jgi:hypothetical protein
LPSRDGARLVEQRVALAASLPLTRPSALAASLPLTRPQALALAAQALPLAAPAPLAVAH